MGQEALPLLRGRAGIAGRAGKRTPPRAVPGGLFPGGFGGGAPCPSQSPARPSEGDPSSTGRLWAVRCRPPLAHFVPVRGQAGVTGVPPCSYVLVLKDVPTPGPTESAT